MLINKIEHIPGRTDIQRTRRLIQNNHRRLLRQHPRQHHPLRLTTRKFPHRPTRQTTKTQPLHHISNNGMITKRIALKKTHIRSPAQQHILSNTHPLR